VEHDPSLRLAATWIPGASAPPAVHGANTSVTVEERLPGGVVVVVVVGAVVVVLTAPAGGCVVVVVGADVPDGNGSIVVVVVDAVAPDNCDLVTIAIGVVAAVFERVPVAVLLLVEVFGEPFDADVDAGGPVDVGRVATPAGTTPLTLGDVVVVPPGTEGLEVVRSGLGSPGKEPGSNAKSSRTATMAKPETIPIPFCSRRTFALFISYPHFEKRVAPPNEVLYPSSAMPIEFAGGG
jgi:hypothetical protein